MLVPCPWCGLRDAAEFRCLGESVTRPDPVGVSTQQWRAYLYLRDNVAGWVTERWYHRMGCRQYFLVERDTRSNEIRSHPADGRQPR